MKVLAIMLFFSVAAFLQCEKGASDAPGGGANPANSVPENARPEPTKQNVKNMNSEIFKAQGEKDGIAYRIAGRLQKKGAYEGVNYPNDNIVVEYELKNTGAKNYILFNQGHSGHSRAVVYAEPAADGSVEVSQKAFTAPADKMCPSMFVAIVPRGAWLKAGQTVKEKVYLELPLKNNAPYNVCEPKAEIAPDASRVKFCLGYQEVAGQDLKIDEEGNLSPVPDFKNQSFLCTEAGELK